MYRIMPSSGPWPARILGALSTVGRPTTNARHRRLPALWHPMRRWR